MIAIVFLMLSPLFIGISNLDANNTARIMEMYVALIGIILLTPVYMPEQSKEIRELVKAKYTRAETVALIRILEAVICLAAILSGFLLLLKQNNCSFSMCLLFWGTLSEAVFLGGIGLCAYAVFEQIAVAYMLPLVYYMINVGNGKKILGDFYLFSISYGSSNEKKYLAAAGICFLLMGLAFPM